MDKRYTIYKCSHAGRRVITSLTAYNLQEAHEALRWLQKHHREEADFLLDEGEFFEILEESHGAEEQPREAVAPLKVAE
ncbi:hypothetical protein [Desulfoferrobacter suflitae]|uniref:hypothetical protein n=1 Tax=Desulfoferrobacter suflitae TaxID=2865782 RepID=UPI002164AF50|nr:hypothetical protein [Desulfoferrobacter suflitae]MCK8602922.1 hypothetical protein [Desulfoferrobacter suflitae]